MNDNSPEMNSPEPHSTNAEPPETKNSETGSDGNNAARQLPGNAAGGGAKKRRRGSRGGQNRNKPGTTAPRGANTRTNGPGSLVAEASDSIEHEFESPSTARLDDSIEPAPGLGRDQSRAAVPADISVGIPAEFPMELPDRLSEGRADAEAATRALVSRPKIGDTRPAPTQSAPSVTMPGGTRVGGPRPSGKRKPKGPDTGVKQDQGSSQLGDGPENEPSSNNAKKKRRRTPRGRSEGRSGATTGEVQVAERRRGRERNGRPIGRYFMCVQVRSSLTQVAVMEGRSLIEHYVSHPADDVGQIHGNIYVGRVQNVLPGMEAAFIDIGTPKNAVLYRGDVQYDAEDIVDSAPRIEQILKGKQLIVCQITKNPIGVKGARLTQEVSLPGRFVVLIPHSKTYGISKRLPDDERKRLRSILDRVKPAEHGLIVRTAAETATEEELHADMTRLLDQWNMIEAKAAKASGPTLLYREPPLAVRVIREEFNADYRGVIIDDRQLFEDVHSYVSAFNPELADRIEYFETDYEGLPIFEKFHVHEQIHKALDRKVWLPSGGSLIIEHTEALTVIDVNTGRNVGTSNLEQTVFQNNLEAAAEVARQLRLRDIGGIIVIDFIDMEIKENRKKVVDAFKNSLAQDKTRTQVFEISELGLVEMTRKRIGEGLLTSYAGQCPDCQGRGVIIDHDLLT